MQTNLLELCYIFRLFLSPHLKCFNPPVPCDLWLSIFKSWTAVVLVSRPYCAQSENNWKEKKRGSCFIYLFLESFFFFSSLRYRNSVWSFGGLCLFPWALLLGNWKDPQLALCVCACVRVKNKGWAMVWHKALPLSLSCFVSRSLSMKWDTVCLLYIMALPWTEEKEKRLLGCWNQKEKRNRRKGKKSCEKKRERESTVARRGAFWDLRAV